MNVDALRGLLLQDQASGTSRPVREYLDRFPGDDLAVLREVLTALDRDPGSDDGKRIGPYRLLHELGRGGQAIVYLAEDTRIRRQVALKVLPPITADASSAALARFRSEAEVSSRLDHPGICDILEADIVRGIPYIAQRYVPGETLARRLASAREAKARPPARAQLDELATLFAKAARALHAAHEAGVVHRDVKPANVMVTPDGEPVVLDFGMARHDDEAMAALSRSGDASGTPAYMSPEQMTGRARPDRRADVWSLGVALWECATLQHPFASATRESLFQAILTEEPPNARRLNPSIDRDLATILATAMHKERDRRYQTALGMAEDLDRWRAREPIAARPAGRLEHLRRWVQRNPALAASAGAVAVLCVVAAALLAYGIGASGRAAAEEQLRLMADQQRAHAEAEQLRMEQDDKDDRLSERLDDLSMQLGTLRFGLEDTGESLGVLVPPFLAELRAFGIDLTAPIDSAAAAARLRGIDARSHDRWRAVYAGLFNFGLVAASAPAAMPPGSRERLLALLAATPRIHWPEYEAALATWRTQRQDTFGPLLTPSALAERSLDELMLLASGLSELDERVADELRVVDRAIELAPDSFRMHFVRFGIGTKVAMAMAEGDDRERLLEQGLVHAQIAVALRPRSGFVRSLLGTALALRGHYPEAIACIDAATSLEPDAALVWLLAARFYSMTPDTQRGIALCKKALQLDPGLGTAAKLLAELEQR